MKYRIRRISKAIGGAVSAGAAAALAAAMAGGTDRDTWLTAIGLGFAGGVLTFLFPANAPKQGS